MIAWLRGMSTAEAAMFALAENVVVFLLALAFGRILSAWRGGTGTRPPLFPLEMGLALLTVGINAGVTLAGWALWKADRIRVREAGIADSAVDALLLLAIMDAAMYALHRVAHHRLFYGWLHAVHHRYEQPRALTLFVMHPLEVLGFGGLWLSVLLAYSPTWGGMSAYLALNVIFGTLGHLGDRVAPSLGPFAGSEFHGLHHRDPSHNLGFYTRIWDRLFGTLAEGKVVPGPSR